MSLQSKLFRGDPKLEAAAVSDPAHITIGAKGEHVRKIQLALTILDGATIELDGAYGPATAGAVLAYKQKCNIVNRSYQTQADNIVGKMAMTSLDSEMHRREIVPHAPVRIVPRPHWVARPPRATVFGALPRGFRPLGLNVASSSGAIGAPGFLPVELKMFPHSAAFFDVIDGWPGLVEILGPPVVKIQPLGGLVSPGEAFRSRKTHKGLRSSVDSKPERRQ